MNENLFVLSLLSILWCCPGCESGATATLETAPEIKQLTISVGIHTLGSPSESPFYCVKGKEIQWNALKKEILLAKTILIKSVDKSRRQQPAIEKVIEYAKSNSIEYRCQQAVSNSEPIDIDHL